MKKIEFGFSGYPGKKRKLLLIMKLTFLLTVVCFLQTSATVYSQATKFSFELKNQRIKDVLREIEENSEFRFFYQREQVDVEQKVNLNISDKTVEEILPELFKGQEVVFDVRQDNLILIKPEKGAIESSTEFYAQQQNSKSGTVTDADGLPLPGVTVVVKGTAQGTVTNADGNYLLSNVRPGSILVFSFVGMLTQEIEVGNKTSIDVTMVVDAIGIEEVVAIGYGTQKRENLTGSVTTVNSVVFEDKIASSPSNLLQGKAAGVTIIQSAGGAPGMSASIKIREVSSWKGSSAPLFVIDGMILDEGAFRRLNPSDIDNISILKDAASAAIYGMQAGNGVVLVTTKSGNIRKTQIVYSANYQQSSPANPSVSKNAYESSLLLNDMNINAGNGNSNDIYTLDELEYFKTQPWQSPLDMLKNPVNQSHNLSVSGGSDRIRYYISGNFYNEKPMFAGEFTKYNFLVKLEGEITNGLFFNLSLNENWSHVEQGFWGYAKGDDTMTELYRQVQQESTNRPLIIDGKYVSSAFAFVDGTFGTDKRSDMRTNPAFGVKYNIPAVKGLTLNASIRYMDYSRSSKQFGTTPKNLFYFKTTGEHNHIYTNEVNTAVGDNGAYAAPFLPGSMEGNSEALYQGSESMKRYQFQSGISYLGQFGKHELQGVAGYEQISSKGEYLTVKTFGFPNLNYQYINGSLGLNDEKKRGINGDAQNLNGQLSFYGRINYNYDQRYLIGLTARADGTYIFSPKKRWGYFPAVSAGWNISKESFFGSLKKYVNDLKLRASYGLTGSLNTAPWQWQQSYNYSSSTGVILGNTSVSGMALGTSINPDITWETNTNIDLGVDISVLNNMFTITADLWNKKTDNILGPRTASVPNTVGATLPAVNYGKAISRGFELAVQYNGKVGALNYSAGGNWAISNNEYLVVDQAAAVRDFENKIGYPINGVVYGYIADGIIRDQDHVNQILDEHGKDFTILGINPRPGMLLYKDIRGPNSDTPDGKVDGNDVDRITTNNIPRVVYGINLNAEYKGLELALNFAGYGKYDIYAGGDWVARNWNTVRVLSLWKDYWTPSNPNASMPNPAAHNWIAGGFQNIEVPSSFWIKSGNFMRLKNAKLSYTLPGSIINVLKPISNVKFYASGDNLLLFSKLYKEWNLDPELGGSSYGYPIMKSVTLGVSVTF
jgi:TonB-linked SusC/RagA family outer membrane protein